jgi:hypothetical protein
MYECTDRLYNVNTVQSTGRASTVHACSVYIGLRETSKEVVEVEVGETYVPAYAQ